MSDWWLVLGVFWGAFLLDGLRRLPRRALFLRRTAPVPAVARFATLHLLPPAPWTWRFTAEPPPFALSPEGICNQPLGTSGRPADPAPFTAVWRWEQIESVTDRRGWFVVNHRLFGPASTAWNAPDLLELARTMAPLDTADREAHLQAWIGHRLRPAHWRRRLHLIRGRTVDLAIINTFTLLAMGATTAIACLTPPADQYEAAPRILSFLQPLLLAAAIGYVWGVVAALVTARRLRRWLTPGTTKAILSSMLFPPHGLRWRRVLCDACPPAPHPLLLDAGGTTDRSRRELFAETVTDLHWPLPPPELRPSASANPPEALILAANRIRSWFGAALGRHVERWAGAAGLTPEEILATPPPDHSGSCMYCPRCGSQFTRSDAACPHGTPLKPLHRL